MNNEAKAWLQGIDQAIKEINSFIPEANVFGKFKELLSAS
jgi:hypothetical protein